jgi:hypothetical protein
MCRKADQGLSSPAPPAKVREVKVVFIDMPKLSTLLHHSTLAAFISASAGALVATSGASALAASITINTRAGLPNGVDSAVTDAVFGDGQPATGLSLYGPTFSFQNGGVTMTFSNPKKGIDPEVSRSTAALGTCLGGSRSAAGLAVCGNNPAVIPQLNSIQVSFNQAVRLLSTSGITRGPLGAEANVQSIWNSGLSAQTFNYNRPVTTSTNIVNYASSFTNFVALAGTPITITSNFVGDVDYWMQNIEFETVNPDEVPSPLPLFGAASAFAWSRRVRRRIKASENVKVG